MHVLVAGCGWLGTSVGRALLLRGDRVTGVRSDASRAEALRPLGIEPLARVVAQASAARAPEWFTLAPAKAILMVLKQASLALGDIDLFEVNEAFAVVNLAVAQELGLDMTTLNVHGGAVALGHPIGASGARILVTLLYAMKRYGRKRGLATLCIGGGEASALIVER